MNHVWRPVIVTAVGIVGLLVVRAWYVPSDFGVHGRNFTYGYHRLGAVDDWANFKIKFRGREYCLDCHEDKVKTILASPHKLIQCENCHGPAIGHPDDNTSLKITGSRELCLRCHTRLAYPQSDRGKLLAVAPDTHNSGENCVECHKPHNPDLEKM